MIVFKSMFNDVLLGEKSSSSRCLHAEDGGETSQAVCLPEERGTCPRVPPVLQMAMVSPAWGHGLLGAGLGCGLAPGMALPRASGGCWGISSRMLNDCEVFKQGP